MNASKSLCIVLAISSFTASAFAAFPALASIGDAGTFLLVDKKSSSLQLVKVDNSNSGAKPTLLKTYHATLGL
ncbi:MAG: hypothetical protein ACXVBL_18890, partial [Bdellovibrionota bacterium]